MPKTQQTEGPIYLNLSGDFKIPNSKTSGSIAGDYRIATLNAFLQSLNETVAANQEKGDYTLDKALRLFVKKADPALLKTSDIVVEVTSKIDPEKHEVVHSFRIASQPKK
jgi:hypothetical protein